jgi:2,3-bisphosphoglycerate-dependent phosphoglycerate mutase
MTGTLIFVRHGRSEWNKRNRFTGWVDVPLAPEGWEEAEKAAKLLEDYKFDAVYTSHLQRAILTMHVILRRNKSQKSPIFLPADGSVPCQSYSPDEKEFPVVIYETALAERHYGDLQGQSKTEIKEKFGEEQFKKWRRGYATPPPNGESLKMTLERALPYFEKEILPRLKNGETVLISAHGNSLRALTKYLEDIPDETITGLEIPTGVPIIYTLNTDNDQPEIVKKEVLELPGGTTPW